MNGINTRTEGEGNTEVIKPQADSNDRGGRGHGLFRPSDRTIASPVELEGWVVGGETWRPRVPWRSNKQIWH